VTDGGYLRSNDCTSKYRNRRLKKYAKTNSQIVSARARHVGK
jgi:hypothetical protein